MKVTVLNEIFEGYQTKQHSFKDKYFKNYKTLLKGPSGDYKQLFSCLIDKLGSLYHCPLSFKYLKEPAILPSGNTIDQTFLKNLIRTNSTDPYNSEKEVKEGKY